MKHKKKRHDIMDLVMLAGAKAVKAVDELGWSFLAAQGYDVTGWDGEDENAAKTVQKRVIEEMQARGENLVYHGVIDNEAPRFAIWYALRRGKKEIAKSAPLQFVQRPQKEGGAPS